MRVREVIEVEYEVYDRGPLTAYEMEKAFMSQWKVTRVEVSKRNEEALP